MQPNTPQDDRSLQVPKRDDAQSPRVPNRDAAVAYMRDQIDRIYEIENQEVPEPQPATKPVVAHKPTSTIDPYHHRHSEANALKKAPQDDAQWKHYHSAWQSYYQQYYERYYLQQLHARQKQIKGSKHETGAAPATPAAASDQKIEVGPDTNEKALTQDQAVGELRSELIRKVSEHGRRVRASRHFMPIVSALVVVLVVGMLQYNRLLIAQVKAYVSPGSMSAQNLIIDPTTDIKVGPEPQLIIPKINVDAPVVYDVPSIAEDVVQSKLEQGVVHYPIPGANSVPGQNGNTVILGHSSNDVFDNGAYKFVFVQLDQLQKGDTFYLHYEGTRYTYSVTGKEVIDPTEVGKLVLPGDKPVATLVTCTPPGTALKRLVIYADQISPNPADADAADKPQQQNNNGVILPGNSPTVFERLFGSN